MSSEQIDQSLIEPDINSNINNESEEKLAKRSKKQEISEDPARIIHIKEFDINSIPPHEVSDSSGVKIVVIGKPGTGKMICQ